MPPLSNPLQESICTPFAHFRALIMHLLFCRPHRRVKSSVCLVFHRSCNLQRRLTARYRDRKRSRLVVDDVGNRFHLLEIRSSSHDSCKLSAIRIPFRAFYAYLCVFYVFTVTLPGPLSWTSIAGVYFLRRRLLCWKNLS